MTAIRKQYPCEVKADGADRRITFKISTGALDRDHDRIDPNGWDVSAYLKNPVVLWAHKYDALPVAKAVAVRAGGGALWATAEFAGHELAEDVFQLYKGGFASAVSVGFIPKAQEPNEYGGHDITAAELLEFSCVPVPSNAEALMIAAAKGLALDRQAAGSGEAKGVIAYRRTPLAPESTPWDAAAEIRAANVEDLRIMCAWYAGDGTNKGDYRLPHHHASGNHACVWRGVANAAARLSQTSLPAGDIPGVKRHLASHYKDFGKEPPWKAAPERWASVETAVKMMIGEITDSRLAQMLEMHGFTEEARVLSPDPDVALLALGELLEGLVPDDPLDDPHLVAEAVRQAVDEGLVRAWRRHLGKLD